MSISNNEKTSTYESAFFSLNHVKIPEIDDAFYLLYALESRLDPRDVEIRIFLIDNDPLTWHRTTQTINFIESDMQKLRKKPLEEIYETLSMDMRKMAIGFVFNVFTGKVLKSCTDDRTFRGKECFNDEEKQKVLDAIPKLELSDAILNKMKSSLSKRNV